jgi:hypothetical protein
MHRFAPLCNAAWLRDPERATAAHAAKPARATAPQPQTPGGTRSDASAVDGWRDGNINAAEAHVPGPPQVPLRPCRRWRTTPVAMAHEESR